jgi:hypothetical protein
MIGDWSPDRGWEFFSRPCADRLWAPPSLLPSGYGVLFPCGVKRPGREVDHSPPSSDDLNAWSYTPTLPLCLHGVVLSQSTETTLPLPFSGTSHYITNEICTTFRTGKHFSGAFPFRNTQKLGHASSPLFFNFALEYAIRKF